MSTERILKVVLLAGLVVASFTAKSAWQTADESVDWIFWLIWPAMLLHQCEENVWTELVLGPKFAFLRWVRTVGYDLSPARALRLNVLVGWTLAVAAGVIGSRAVYFPLFVILVETVNGFWHLSVTALERRWSPGTLSSVLVTVPLGFGLCYFALDRGLLTPTVGYSIFIVACLSHHLFLASLPRATPSDLAAEEGPL